MNGPRVPFDDLLHFRRTLRAPGDVVVEVDVDERYHNPMGIVHGGVLCGLLDTAMGASVTSTLAAGETCINMDFHVRFLRPAVRGRLLAEARWVRRGKGTVVMEASVHDDAGEEVARASSTFLLRPRH